MKKLQMGILMLLSFTAIYTNAQSTIPQDYVKGTIVLANGTSLSGYLKDDMRKNATVSFYDEADKKKKEFDGTEINSVQLNNDKFICIGGDFFKVLSEGELNFLQKASNASGKIIYNGLENVVSNGTEGKPGDYFICNSNTKELTKLSKKNIDVVTASSFAGCAAAIEKAKSINGDITRVKDAVEIFNSRNNK
jgi:hypothetical protein